MNNASCLHLCIEKWGGQYVCIRCHRYLNYDDGLDTGDKKHLANLHDASREAQEREIEASIIPDAIPPGLSEEERKEHIGKLSKGRGVPIGWLVEFTIANDCWDMTTQEVCRKFVYPATAASRCRYVELDHMKEGITGPASTYILHCRESTWGDLVAALCDGNADRNKTVWIDIFACRQWPSSCPDLDFASTIRHCSSFMVVCSSLKEVADFDYYEALSRRSCSLPKYIRHQIAFLRVECLVEIHAATECEIPIIMKGGSYCMVDKSKSLFEFKHNLEMLLNLSNMIDISNSEATIPSDKQNIFDQIRGSDGSGIEKLNSKVRGIISSAYELSCECKDNGIVGNAACGDSSCLALVLANPSDYICLTCGRRLYRSS